MTVVDGDKYIFQTQISEKASFPPPLIIALGLVFNNT